MKKIVITGSEGLLGSEISKFLEKTHKCLEKMILSSQRTNTRQKGGSWLENLMIPI